MACPSKAHGFAIFTPEFKFTQARASLLLIRNQVHKKVGIIGKCGTRYGASLYNYQEDGNNTTWKIQLYMQSFLYFQQEVHAP